MKDLTSSDRKLLFPTWAAADALGQITLLSMPFMMGMYITRLRLGPADAGMLISIEMCTLSAVCMAVALLVNRLSKRALALTGALIALGGNCLSLLDHAFAMLVLSRMIAALGYGLAMAAGNSAVTSAEDPARLYDNKMMLFALTQLVVVILVPLVNRYAGVQGFFVFLIVVNALMVPLVARLPRSVSQSNRGSASSARTTSDLPALTVAALILSAVAVYSIRESFCWAFVERLGANLKVNGEMVGILVGVGTLPAILAPRLATVLRERFGDIAPTLLGIIFGGGILYAIAMTANQSLFLALLVIWPGIYFYTVPLLMGIAARIDSKGRVIAAAAGAIQIAFAAGPAVAGLLVEWSGPAILGRFILMATGALVILIAGTAIGLRMLARETLRPLRVQNS